MQTGRKRDRQAGNQVNTQKDSKVNNLSRQVYKQVYKYIVEQVNSQIGRQMNKWYRPEDRQKIRQVNSFTDTGLVDGQEHVHVDRQIDSKIVIQKIMQFDRIADSKLKKL